MPPLVSVFTPSFNKAGYAVEAVQSVLAQTFTDFEYWILENSTDGGKTRRRLASYAWDPRVIYEEINLTEAERAENYPTALLLNRYYPKANGRYIFYLSDDDLFVPECLDVCVRFLEADPARMVCYFSLVSYAVDAAGHSSPFRAIPASRAFTPGDRVDCVIDGGQIAHRKDALDAIEFPYFPQSPAPNEANHCDGLFMQKLADVFTFWPVGQTLVTGRHTPISTWNRSA